LMVGRVLTGPCLPEQETVIESISCNGQVTLSSICNCNIG
jgi:hypothetical protein